MPQLPFTYRGKKANKSANPEDKRTEVLSVSALQHKLRLELEKTYPTVLVSGEIVGLTIPARSGHAYFALKDKHAQIKCVMWRDHLERLRFQLEDGQEVVVRGKVTIYERGGTLQLNATHVAPLGLGELQQEFQQRVEKLQREGLTSEERKRPPPPYPRCIGVVTSRSGAALRDIVQTALRRDPAAHLTIVNTQVQGRGAAFSVASALGRLDRAGRCDVILLARGGGSLEDLWCFNEEAVARAIVKCSVPVVTGIGHETDHTIADLVADVRASTPTAAAETVVPVREEIRQSLEALEARLLRGFLAQHAHHSKRVLLLAARLKDPQTEIRRRAQVIDDLMSRAERAIRTRVDADRRRLVQLDRRRAAQAPGLKLGAWSHEIRLLEKRADHAIAAILEGAKISLARATDNLRLLSPLSVLSRGYAIVSDEEGRIIRSAQSVEEGQTLEIQLADGLLKVIVQASTTLTAGELQQEKDIDDD